MARPRASPAEARARRAAVEDQDVVSEAALRFLEVRQRSAHEVRRRLVDAGYRTDLVETAIARLTDVGVLDDEAFARAWVQSRDRARPRGERALRLELGRKGIARSTIDEVLGARRDGASEGQDSLGSFGPGARGPREDEVASAALPPEVDVEALAADHLLARQDRSLRRVGDPRVRRHRAYALLARNGFDPETSAAAVRRAEEGWAADAAAQSPAMDGIEGRP